MALSSLSHICRGIFMCGVDGRRRGGTPNLRFFDIWNVFNSSLNFLKKEAIKILKYNFFKSQVFLPLFFTLERNLYAFYNIKGMVCKQKCTGNAVNGIFIAGETTQESTPSGFGISLLKFYEKRKNGLVYTITIHTKMSGSHLLSVKNFHFLSLQFFLSCVANVYNFLDLTTPQTFFIFCCFWNSHFFIIFTIAN